MTTFTIQTLTPIDGTVIFETAAASNQEIEAALTAGRHARATLSSLSIDERKAICTQALAILEQDKDEIAREITLQMGRPISHSKSEINGVKERAEYMIDIADTALADLIPDPIKGQKRFIRRTPQGAVLIVAPWNYPLLTIANALFPALLAGNNVIIKPSSQTPLSAQRFVDAFDAAGLPKGALQCLHMDHTSTEKLLQDRLIDFLCFTGSVNAGRKLGTLSAGQFIGAGLELGGKDPAYVLEDANIDHSVEQLVDGAFFNAGQSCCGIERIYVHEKNFKSFVEGYVELANQYRLGNPLEPTTTLGPVVKKQAADFIRQQVTAAVGQGAKTLIDPNNHTCDTGQTAYLSPQVLTGVSHEMALMREESFGPVVGIMPVKSDAQAIELMNDSNLGLTASLWTNDLDRAESLGNKIETGTVFMNRCDYLDPALAWTGVKDTGIGVSLSPLGFQQLTRAKSFNLRSID